MLGSSRYFNNNQKSHLQANLRWDFCINLYKSNGYLQSAVLFLLQTKHQKNITAPNTYPSDVTLS